MLSRWITAAAGWAAKEFHHLDQRGAEIPEGAVLVVANHPNALLDPLIIFRIAGRPVRPLAKEPLFKHLLIGPVLKALGGLSVYRRQDHPAGIPSIGSLASPTHSSVSAASLSRCCYCLCWEWCCTGGVDDGIVWSRIRACSEKSPRILARVSSCSSSGQRWCASSTTSRSGSRQPRSRAR